MLRRTWGQPRAPCPKVFDSGAVILLRRHFTLREVSNTTWLFDSAEKKRVRPLHRARGRLKARVAGLRRNSANRDSPFVLLETIFRSATTTSHVRDNAALTRGCATLTAGANPHSMRCATRLATRGINVEEPNIRVLPTTRSADSRLQSSRIHFS